MALAVIMIVLLGVMGAGLLTFVNRDLNTVVEENRGQRAFEVADAGIGAAKRQLASNVDRTKYDGSVATPGDDIQWSTARGGLTLNNLDGDGTTADSVNVEIKYRGSTTDDFRVISTGTYGNSKRKIEAIFKGVVASGGGGGSIGHPLYYTPSSISIHQQVTLSGISMFSGQDILMEGLTTPISLVNDWEDAGGALKIPNPDDELKDWDSTKFTTNPGTWNTVPGNRTLTDNKGVKSAFEKPGFAAEGKICGFSTGTIPPGACGTSSSVADGVYGYDSTTGAKTMSRTGYPKPWGNNLKFAAKEDLTPPLDVKATNPSGIVTYPFPRPVPIPLRFKQLAQGTNSYFVGNPTDPNWGLSSSTPDKVAFVDAQNTTVTFDPPGTQQFKGIIVVWCGDLRSNQNFKGIVMNLKGDNLPGNSSCGSDPSKGVYRNMGQLCQCWVYAEGGNSTRAGIDLLDGSEIRFLPAGDWSFLNDAFASSSPPTSFALHGWREVYQ